jgi:aspartate/methionine/tyrosine aminotransferase
MPATIDPFYAIGINLLAQRLEAEGRSVIHMEYGQPSGGAPAKAVAAAHRALEAGGMGYWESPALKDRLARHYRDAYGLAVDPERFVLTCGASAALVLALSVCFDAGDEVATARPGYVAYRNTLKALHLKPVEIPCDAATRYQLTAAHLDALKAPPKGVILASPANPTGTIIAPDELERIAAVCRAGDITAISDEIYHGISYAASAETILKFDPNAFVLGSFSKYFGMTAWRLGWLLAPPDRIARARALVGNLFLTAPTLSQHAALAAFEDRDELEARIRVYKRNRDLMLAALPRLGLDRIAPPDGAFYIYADVRHLTDDSLAFCKRLIAETGVATAPGIDFDPDAGRHHIRFSFALATADIEEALSRLEPWFATRAGK